MAVNYVRWYVTDKAGAIVPEGNDWIIDSSNTYTTDAKPRHGKYWHSATGVKLSTLPIPSLDLDNDKDLENYNLVVVFADEDISAAGSEPAYDYQWTFTFDTPFVCETEPTATITKSIKLASARWSEDNEYYLKFDFAAKAIKFYKKGDMSNPMATIAMNDEDFAFWNTYASADYSTVDRGTNPFYIRWYWQPKGGTEFDNYESVRSATDNGFGGASLFYAQVANNTRYGRLWSSKLASSTDLNTIMKVKLVTNSCATPFDIRDYELVATIGTTGDETTSGTVVTMEPTALAMKYIFKFGDRGFEADNIDDSSLKTIPKTVIYDTTTGKATPDLFTHNYSDILTDLSCDNSEFNSKSYFRWYIADSDGKKIADMSDWTFTSGSNAYPTFTKSDEYGYYVAKAEISDYRLPSYDPEITFPASAQANYKNYRIVCVVTTDLSGLYSASGYQPYDNEPTTMQVKYVFTPVTEEEYYAAFPGTLTTPYFNHSKEVLIPAGTTSVVVPLNESLNKILKEYDKSASELADGYHVRWYVTKKNDVTGDFETVANPESFLSVTSGQTSMKHTKVPGNGIYWNTNVYNGTNPWSTNPSYTDALIKNLLNITFTIPDATKWEDYKVIAVMTDDLTGQVVENNVLSHEPDNLNMQYVFNFFMEHEFVFVHSKGTAGRNYVKHADDDRLAATVQQYSWNNDNSERTKLDPNEDIRQGVHTYEYTIYVDNSSSASPIELVLPFTAYKGTGGGNVLEPASYIRWYDWKTDMASSKLTRVGSGLVNTDGLTTGTPEYNYNNGVMQRGWFYINNDTKGVQPRQSLMGVTFNPAGMSDSDVEVIACDVSKYYDGIYSGSNGEYMLHEPTLSVRYIFNLKPASMSANAIEGNKEDTDDSNGIKAHTGAANFNAAIAAMAATDATHKDYSKVKGNMFNLFEDNGRVVVSVKDANSVFVLRANLANLDDYYIKNGSTLVKGDNIKWYSYYEDASGLWVLADDSGNPLALTELTAGDGLYFGSTTQNARISPFSLTKLNAVSGTSKYVLLTDPTKEKELTAAPGQKFHLVGFIGNSTAGVSTPTCHYELRFINSPAYKVESLPGNRKDEFFVSHYERVADPVNFDEYMSLDKPESQVENFADEPLPWDDAAYGYCYPSIDQYRIHALNATYDYMGLSPLHGDYTLAKSINITDGGTNISDGWGEDANSQVTGPNYSLHWWTKYSIYDYTHVYESTYHGDNTKYGTFFYVDAADESRTMAILPFDAKLCSGSEIHFTMAIADMTEAGKLTPQVCAHVWEVDEHGKKLQQVISFLTCELNSVTSDGSKAGDGYYGHWWQVYGHGTLPSNIGLDGTNRHFVVEVDNYSRHTDGADYCVDQITFYTNSANVKVDQKNAACDDKLEMTVYMDAEMLKSTALQESDTPQTLYWRLVTEGGTVVTGNDVYSYYDDEGTLHTDDGSMTYGKLWITTNYKLDDDGNLLPAFKVADGMHQSGFFKDDFGVVYYQLTKSQFPMTEDQKYYIAIYDIEDGLTSTPDAGTGTWHNITSDCAVVSKLFAPQKVRLSLKDPISGKAATTVNGACGGAAVNVNLAVEMQYPVSLDEDSKGYKTYDAHYDFYQGVKSDYVGITNLKEAIKDFRSWDKTTNSSYQDYSNATNFAAALETYNTYKGGTTETPNAYYTALKNNQSNLVMAASLNSLTINGFVGTGGTTYNFVAIAAEDETSDGKTICDELAVSFKYEASGDGPILELGFEDVSYPTTPSKYVRVVRLGKEQMDNLQKSDGFVLHVPVHSFKTSETAIAKEGALKITSSFLQLVKGTYTTDASVTSSVDVATFEQTNIDASNMFIAINFHGTGVTAQEFKEGYAYQMFFKYDVAGGSTGCDGDMNFIIKMVPEFVTWNDEATGATAVTQNTNRSNNWSNDQNWSRSRQAELYKTDGHTPTTAHPETTYTDYASTPATYVPMKFTYVTLPKGNVAPNLISPVLGTTTTGTDMNNGIITNIGAGATDNIQYDMMVRYTEQICQSPTAHGGVAVDAKIYDCEKFYTNWCKEIYFKPEAELINQQYLTYEKAWVEKELTSNKWYLMSAPLKQTYAGDMYVPKSDGRQTTEAFRSITFGDGTGDYSRTKYPFYQRSWGKEHDSNVYTQTSDVYRSTYSANLGFSSWSGNVAEWGHTFNDVDYTAMTGFSVRAHKQDGKGTALIRLPKDDVTYKYYDYSGTEKGTQVSTFTKTSGEIGKFVTAAGNADVTLTISNAQQMGGYVLVGNPYMASLDMKKFFDGNPGLTKTYYTYDASAMETYAGSGIVHPLQGFFVQKGTATQISFTADMMMDGNTGTATPASGARRRALTLTAENERGRSAAAVEIGEGASAGFVEAEDVETLFDSNLADVPMVFTVAGGQAVSIDVRPELDIVPFGVACTTSDEPVTVTLEMDGRQLTMVDAVTGATQEVGDGGTVTVAPNEYGRYFLTASTTDLKTVLNNAAGIEGAVYNVNGQRVTRPAKGLYIVNGRKVVVK